MVLGFLIVTSIPLVTGVCQAVSAQGRRDQQQKDERRMRRFHIDVESEHPEEIHHGRLVLQNGRLWIRYLEMCEDNEHGHVAEAFYIEYPDAARDPVELGLVSQVCDSPPLLNWIYVDRDTLELKYGNKTASIEHHIGSWDWTDDEACVTLENTHGDQSQSFCAVRTSSGSEQQLFFDMNDDDLHGIVWEKWPKSRVRLMRRLISDASTIGRA